MERAVKKNSKEFASAIAAASAVRVYSLDNGFTGVSSETFPRWIGDDFKLYATSYGYKARVHSNLWVEFKAAA